MNMPTDKTLGRRLANRFGRFLAARRKNVTIARNALISPEAKICARAGAICIGAGSTGRMCAGERDHWGKLFHPDVYHCVRL